MRRLDKRGPVPGKVAAADQSGVNAGEALRSIVGGEAVRLVRQDDQVRACGQDLIDRDPRITLGVPCVKVIDTEPGEDISGERFPADDHPGSAPDRDHGPAPPLRTWEVPGLRRRIEPAGRGEAAW